MIIHFLGNINFFYSVYSQIFTITTLFCFFFLKEMEVEQSNVLRFRGCSHFRQRLICATLSGKKVLISSIRADDQNPGLQG